MSVEFPRGWRRAELREIAGRITKGTTPTSIGYEFSSDGVPFIKIESISPDGSLMLDKVNFVSAECNNALARSIIKRGTILFSIAGTLGRVCVYNYDFPSNTNQAVAIISAIGQDVDIKYLSLFLQSSEISSLIERLKTVGAQPNISLKQLGDLIVPLPPLPEQQRIAEILSSVDESIRATEAVIAQAERVKRGLMEDLLTGGLGSAAIANGEVPEGWDRNILKELFVVKSSKRVFERQWRKEGIPFYRGREITALSENGRVDNDLFIDAELYEEFSRTNGVPKENDILITAIGTIGNTYLVDGSHKFYFKDASVLWLSSLNKVESKFINYWLKSDLFSSQRDIGNGTTVDSLTIGQLGGLQISFPPREDQLRIIEILSSVDDQITTNRATVEQLQRLKRGLMDDLLTGKVRTVA